MRAGKSNRGGVYLPYFHEPSCVSPFGVIYSPKNRVGVLERHTGLRVELGVVLWGQSRKCENKAAGFIAIVALEELAPQPILFKDAVREQGCGYSSGQVFNPLTGEAATDSIIVATGSSPRR
jgi:hypothetical protein